MSLELEFRAGSEVLQIKGGIGDARALFALGRVFPVEVQVIFGRRKGVTLSKKRGHFNL